MRRRWCCRFEAPAGLGSLNVLVDGKSRGKVNSPALVKALFGTYLDRSAVSPSLKSSIASTLPSWFD